MKKNSKKKSIQAELIENTRRLVKKIPIEQRRKIVKNRAYLQGWLDSTFFWYHQFNEVFDKWIESRIH
jgi:hypothetical protein